MPVKFLAAPAQPPTGSDALCTTMSSFSTFTCSGLRPVCSAQREGLQYLKMYARSSSMPLCTSASRFGVCTSGFGEGWWKPTLNQP